MRSPLLLLALSGSAFASVSTSESAAWEALNAPVQACFDVSNNATPGMSGSVSLQVGVAADGQVSSVSLLDADLGDPDAYVCMMDAAREARFPAKASVLTHTWTFPAAVEPAPAAAVWAAPTARTLREVLMHGLKRAGRCYDEARARQPGLKGGLVLNLHIGQGGKTGPVEVASSSLGSEPMEACVADAFRTLVFPETDENQLLFLPMAFPIT